MFCIPDVCNESSVLRVAEKGDPHATVLLQLPSAPIKKYTIPLPIARLPRDRPNDIAEDHG
jgi:hypothetical protein